MTDEQIENAMWDRNNWHPATESMALKYLAATPPVARCSGGFLAGEVFCHEGPQAEPVHPAFIQVGQRYFARYITARRFAALTSPRNISRLRAELTAFYPTSKSHTIRDAPQEHRHDITGKHDETTANDIPTEQSAEQRTAHARNQALDRNPGPAGSRSKHAANHSRKGEHAGTR